MAGVVMLIVETRGRLWLTDASSAAWRLKRRTQQWPKRLSTKPGSKRTLDSHVRCSNYVSAPLIVTVASTFPL